jgi:hypothetical protein
MAETLFDDRASDGVGTYIACRCEDVSMAAVIYALQHGASTLNDVKRRTRVGMGPCQGIYCMPAVAALVSEAKGVPISLVEPMTLRPPVRLVGLELFAAEEQATAIRFHTREGNEYAEEG